MCVCVACDLQSSEYGQEFCVSVSVTQRKENNSGRYKEMHLFLPFCALSSVSRRGTIETTEGSKAA